MWPQFIFKRFLLYNCEPPFAILINKNLQYIFYSSRSQDITLWSQFTNLLLKISTFYMVQNNLKPPWNSPEPFGTPSIIPTSSYILHKLVQQLRIHPKILQLRIKIQIKLWTFLSSSISNFHAMVMNYSRVPWVLIRHMYKFKIVIWIYRKFWIMIPSLFTQNNDFDQSLNLRLQVNHKVFQYAFKSLGTYATHTRQS